MYTDNAKGVVVDKDLVVSLSWNEWKKLDASNDDFNIKTIQKQIKVPKVIVLNHYDKIPRQAVKFTQKNLWLRDNFTCQYTGKKLTKLTGNIDHVIPKSQGGKTSWENCVIAHKQINDKKADKTPEQAGLRLTKTPAAPKLMPVSFYIINKNKIKEWELFLKN
jgi:5-methylcytosine-specific restriction endonuclease McrA